MPMIQTAGRRARRKSLRHERDNHQPRPDDYHRARWIAFASWHKDQPNGPHFPQFSQHSLFESMGHRNSLANSHTPKPKPKLSSSRSRTIGYAELPAWAQDNEFILGGYRRISYNWKACFDSLFGYLHNETVNIHSHLAGGLLFAYFFATYKETWLQQYPTTWADTLALGIFLACAIFCLLSSAFFHTSACHSQKVMGQCHALDYSGILILIMGSQCSAIRYEFFCNPYQQAFYSILLISIGCSAAYVLLNPTYATPAYRSTRATLFIALGLGGIIPVTHCVIRDGAYTVFIETGHWWLLFSAFLYIFGGILYANRIPESLSPGTFDYFFASHQIFHVCVLGGVGAHYTCVLRGLEYSYSHLASCAA
ncbi:Hemolysin-III channel protein Izh2 [Mycena indigotica]|uniref:Hemolysin-III channel protein Izh2 n=1 Tax=Mycena indigotica TaxID=2126181 RepID=A0A8H6TIJ7_9AGAR|nr:Hemolysin-III channel protein Izh2 [Mycena indigotica]KAF7316375.1 Hemolysin-III channel protein Izh2 [Mycena indigotica]